MESYNNLIDAINALRSQGYTVDFNLCQNGLDFEDGNCRLLHDEFEIDKFFRFDNDEDPSDQSILYAISSVKHNMKGILINAYGIYSDPLTNEMLNKLMVK